MREDEGKAEGKAHYSIIKKQQQNAKRLHNNSCWFLNNCIVGNVFLCLIGKAVTSVIQAFARWTKSPRKWSEYKQKELLSNTWAGIYST